MFGKGPLGVGFSVTVPGKASKRDWCFIANVIDEKKMFGPYNIQCEHLSI